MYLSCQPFSWIAIRAGARLDAAPGRPPGTLSQLRCPRERARCEGRRSRAHARRERELDRTNYRGDRSRDGKAEKRDRREAERRPPVPDPDNAGEGRSPRRPFPADMVAMSPVTGPEQLVVAARAAGVTDHRMLEAIGRTPRAAFVPGAYASRAYDDAPVPIPHGQVTTQPSLSAAMIAALGLSGAEEVLEVGTGYGYQTALLARLAARVVSIDIWPDLAA